MITESRSASRTCCDLWVFSLFALVFVFASKSLWYDLRLIHRELLDPSRFRLLFIVYALLLLPFLIVVLSRDVIGVLTKRWSWLFAALAWYGLVPALIHRNDLIYIAQDLFKLSFVPAGYLAYRLARERLDVKRFALFLATSVLLFEIVRLAIHVLAKGTGTRLVYGTIIDVLPVAAFFAFMLHSTGARRFLFFLLTVASLLMSLIGQKRTVLACICLLACFFVVSTLRKNTTFVVFAAIVTTCALAALALAGALSGEFEVDVFRRLAATDVRADIGESSVRFKEVKIAMRTLKEGGVGALLFGYGHGATFELWHPVRGVETVHSMHFTPAAMIFRYGFFGVVFFAILFVAIWRLVLRRTSIAASADEAAVTLMGKGYLLSASIGCFLLFGLVDDLLCGVFLGVVEDGTRRTVRE